MAIDLLACYFKRKRGRKLHFLAKSHTASQSFQAVFIILPQNLFLSPICERRKTGDNVFLPYLCVCVCLLVKYLMKLWMHFNETC